MARAAVLSDVEDLPEADRLDGYPHPRATVHLFGHEAAERTLLDLFASGRLHHGWIIAGAGGIGKATLAYRFARFLLAAPEHRDPLGGSLAIDPESSAAHLVAARAHPGLLVLRRPYDTKSKRLRQDITIDEARRLRGFLGLTPEENAWRVVIVDSADDLNIPAANALLKSLEEPPARTIFLLVSSAPGRLLTTLRSRCRTLELHPLAPEPLRRAIVQAVAAGSEENPPLPAGADWDVLATLAEGSVRRFLVLHAAGGLDLYRRIEALVAALPRVDWSAVHALADDLASPASESQFELFYDLLLGLLARLLRAAATGNDAQSGAALARRLMPDAALAEWAEVWETISAEKRDAEMLNLDRRSLILGTFSHLARASQG